ncbi:helix-turn-helix domain-containing protein [uncultured Erythrobacter sp.]|uniref:helix-turn-helix domain-containing protein n=1 Tax=uncultured Erythrobacter sp. TaxID=263913 RepID=UPI0026188A2D|nr:helix-turn-helix domain-containing protein [uncultured Erythrobacter sp.]
MALKAHLDPQTKAAPGLIEGRRQSRRAMRLETSGVLPGGLEANVTIHNLSAAGLLIQTGLSLSVGEVLSVDLPDLGPVGAEIVWQSGELFGCAFQQALGEAALAAAELRSASGVEVAPPAPSQSAGPAIGDSFGMRLNRLRRERSLTLAQVANALGVSKPTVWAWEKGKARPLPERIAAIAAVLGVSEGDLSEAHAGAASSALVDECRLRIASQYGTDPGNVRIMVEL